MRVLQKQQQIGQRSVDDLPMEPSLELKRLHVADDAEGDRYALSATEAASRRLDPVPWWEQGYLLSLQGRGLR